MHTITVKILHKNNVNPMVALKKSDGIISVMRIHLLRTMNVYMKCCGNANWDILVNTMPTLWGRHRIRNCFTKVNRVFPLRIRNIRTTFQRNAFNNCWLIIHETKRWPHAGTVAKVTITKVVRIHHLGTMNVGMKYQDNAYNNCWNNSFNTMPTSGWH